MQYKQADSYGQQNNYQQPNYGQPAYNQQQQQTGYNNYQQAPQTAYQQVPQGQQPVMGSPAMMGSPTGPDPYGKNHEHTLEGEPLYADMGTGSAASRFRVNGYQDVWAMVLFYIQFLACIIVAGINIGNSKFSVTDDNSVTAAPGTYQPTTVTFNTGEVAKLFAKSAGSALGFSVLFTLIFLGLIRSFPASFIWIAQGFFIVLFAAYAGFGFYLGITIMGVIGIIFCLFSALWLFLVRHRIPFSALLLEISANSVMTYYGSVVCAFVTLAFGIVYFVFWAMMTIPSLAKFSDSEYSDNMTAVYGIVFLFLVMFYWTQQLLVAIVHCTSAGAVATWYFFPTGQVPPNPAWAAFKRAMTTSFGSLAFGSLIVAILKAIETMVRSAARNNRQSFMACIAVCILSCIRRLMEYFNTYAFSFIAVYGCDYITAAKSVFQMIFSGSIFSAIINDILCDRVFVMVSIFIAALNGIINYFIFKNTDYVWVAVIAGILVGLLVAGIVFNTVASGCTTLIVCVSDAPGTLAELHPELGKKLHHAIRELRKGCCDASESAESA